MEAKKISKPNGSSSHLERAKQIKLISSIHNLTNKNQLNMKKIVLAICFVASMIGTYSCSKTENQKVVANQTGLVQVMTLAPPTPGEMHNAALAEYDATYGLGPYTTSLTYAQVETIMSRINQIMIDQGTLTGTDEEAATSETMASFTNLGLFNAGNVFKPRAEVLSILLDKIQNSTIKTAHLNIINYTGTNIVAYANDQFDNLLSSSALSASEKSMIEGAKGIYNSSMEFWGNHYETEDGRFQGIMDEMGYMIGYINAWAYGLDDRWCALFGVYNAVKMSTLAAM